MSSLYHHGALPDALRQATVELLSERGPAGFSLREVARRAGVSHSAPKHHFGDARGLLTSVATEGFRLLGDAFERAAAEAMDATDRLTRFGHAYVNHALGSPGHFGPMTQLDLVDPDDPDFVETASRAYELLVQAVEALRDELNQDLDVETAAMVCWASMHGLVTLTPKFAHMAEHEITSPRPLNSTVEQFTALLVNGFRAR